jgi:methyl-accepting chemotaxis protein
LRDFGAGLAAKQKAEPEETAQMQFLVRQAASSIDAVNKSVSAAIRYNAALEAKLAGPLAAAAASAARFTRSSARDLGAVPLARVETKAYFESGKLALGDSFRLYDAGNTALGELLRERTARLSKEKYTQLTAAGLVLVVAILAIYWVSRGITAQVNSIMRMFSQIGIGNYEARCEVTSRDELGAMARSLNSVLDNTLALIQSREERDQIQTSIRKLLEEVSGVAEGDLSKEAEVTSDVTGAIADSFNFMIAELRQIIGQVQMTTRMVTNSASQVQGTAEQLASGSEGQAKQIQEVSASIERMAHSIQQVSATAGSAASVANQALETAQQGAETVSKTIDGMHSIRAHVQETAKRIKRLGESSQEIGEIVQLIRDIADRTSILALNASIQAAQAGEAGKGFAIVAEEVERLAERAAESTRRIASLIQSVQGDTNEAISAMEATTREVVGGSQLANEAGQKLAQIEEVSRQISGLVKTIAEAAVHQAQSSVVVTQNVTAISRVTQETAQGARDAAASIRRLAQQAEQLNESVSRFKLPEEDGASLAA